VVNVTDGYLKSGFNSRVIHGFFPHVKEVEDKILAKSGKILQSIFQIVISKGTEKNIVIKGISKNRESISKGKVMF
jgi:hypothetical protein